MIARLLAISLCFSITGFAQSTTAKDSITFKSLTFTVFSDGTVRDFRENDTAHKLLLYSHQLWIQGLDDQSMIHFAGQTSGIHRTDYTPGPVSNDPDATMKYDKVWKISSQMITDFINNPNAPIPHAILNWPAHGDPTFGEAADLAPFVDVDNNGQYIPQNGDYPCIPGDQAIFFMFNDNNGPSPNMGIEIHGMAYVIDSSDYLDSTFFIDYKIYNRSPRNFTEVNIGIYSDFDIGSVFDDLVGTEVEQSSIYSYNAYRNAPFLGYSLGSSAMIWLKGPAAPYFDGIDNDRDGCIDGIKDPIGNCIAEDPANNTNENWQLSNSYTQPGFISESTPSVFSYLLSGYCPNGMPKTMGNGSGLWDPSNTPYSCIGSGNYTDFVYTGNSYDHSGTYQPSLDVNWFQNPNNWGDMRAFGGSGDFNLNNQLPAELSIAYTWHQADSAQSSIDAGLSGLFQKIRRVRNNYSSQPPSCKAFNISLPEKKLSSFQYFYNYSNKTLELLNKRNTPIDINIYTITGQKLTDIKLLPHGNFSLDASGFPSGIWILREANSPRAVKILVR